MLLRTSLALFPVQLLAVVVVVPLVFEYAYHLPLIVSCRQLISVSSWHSASTSVAVPECLYCFRAAQQFGLVCPTVLCSAPGWMALAVGLLGD